jgi:hypothetical protein
MELYAGDVGVPRQVRLQDADICTLRRPCKNNRSGVTLNGRQIFETLAESYCDDIPKVQVVLGKELRCGQQLRVPSVRGCVSPQSGVHHDAQV